MGNSDGVIDEAEIGTYMDNARKKGMDSKEYYNWLLDNNFKAEDASNHGFYQEVLQKYQEIQSAKQAS